MFMDVVYIEVTCQGYNSPEIPEYQRYTPSWIP